MTDRPHPWPAEGDKKRALLNALLHGTRIDPFNAIMDFNLSTPQARMSELRRMGWPIRSIKFHHPKLEGEFYVGYVLDTHFRAWFTENPNAHPADYPGQDGRGKFTTGENPARSRARPAPATATGPFLLTDGRDQGT